MPGAYVVRNKDLIMLASTNKTVLKNKDASGEATFKEANNDKELSTLKVATLLIFKVTANPNTALKDNNANKRGGSKPLRT